MYMDEGEIVRDFLQAKDRKAQVEILAQRNLISESDVLAVLARNGVDVKDCKSENPKFMRLYKEGLSDPKMAEALGVSCDTVRRWRRRNGLPNNFRRTAQQENLLMNLWLSGKNDREIAEAVGRAPSTISEWRKKNGLPPNYWRGRKY